jgi:heme/copper-type cytochrome/quinol oxidase subunit 2
MALFTIKKVYNTIIGQPADQNNSSSSKFVNFFALVIVFFSITVIGILIWVAYTTIHAIKDDVSFDHSKELFNILLPVIGTWMGTLLAFYFSKENFKAANQQAKDLVNTIGGSVDQNLQQLKVKDVMIKTENAQLLTFDSPEDFKKEKLIDLYGKMEDTQSERLLILKRGDMTFIFNIYRTTIGRFMLRWERGKITLKETTGTPKDKKDLTVGDMYESDDPTFNGIVKLVPTFIAQDATLDKVKEAMKDNSICQDVYVTENGSKDERVLGWITNSLVIEKAGLFTRSNKRQ